MRILIYLVLVALSLLSCKSPEVGVGNRACDVITTAASGATCHDWGRHVAVGSADVDVAFVGVNGVWQWCTAGSTEPTCKTVMDLRPKPEPAAPATSPPPAAPASPAPPAYPPPPPVAPSAAAGPDAAAEAPPAAKHGSSKGGAK